MNLVDELKNIIEGDVDANSETLETYSHDTSLFEVRPEVVVYPKHSKDIQALVDFVKKHRKDNPDLSLTARAAGSGMSGGSLNESIIMDVTRYFKKIGKVSPEGTHVEPGVFYRDFEPVTHKKGYYLPSYPASKHMAALGGMVNNNSGGEKSLQKGQTVDYVRKMTVVLSDGKEYTFGPLSEKKLKKKMAQKDFEGKIYKKIYKLITENEELIKSKRPKVSKNSTGYNLWQVWDGKTFNLAKIFVGSQGTLGITTDSVVSLVPTKEHSGLLAVYMYDMEQLPEFINRVLEKSPEDFEVFDDHTMMLALKFIPQFIALLGPIGTVKMGLTFLPKLAMFATKGLPKFTYLIEFEGKTKEEVEEKIQGLVEHLKPMNLVMQKAETEEKANQFKTIRRESFNLLRKNVRGRHTAPFIDDFIVPPKELLSFFPKLIKVMKEYDLDYTIAGHIGDGNFHVIPLMDLSDPKEKAKIPKVMDIVIDLVLEHGGSISAEHNEGLTRGPYIKKMYGQKMFDVFKEVKNIFDPDNIFNPKKKTDADLEYSLAHIRDHF